MKLTIRYKADELGIYQTMYVKAIILVHGQWLVESSEGKMSLGAVEDLNYIGISEEAIAKARR